MMWTADLLRQLPCLVSGHDGRRAAGAGELFLKCTRCGGRSTGWQVPATVRPAPPAPVTIVVLPTIEDVAEFVGTVDESTAQLLGELDLAGQHDKVQLLLAPAGTQVH